MLVPEGTHLQNDVSADSKNDALSLVLVFLVFFRVDVVTGKHSKVLLIVINLRKCLKSLSSLAANTDL